jgi:glycosyltransferase involved in cell wall biosynthesis
VNATRSRQPRVSVVLPAFNAQDTIEAAVDSILRQSLTNLELIVVDDGSKDATPELLAGMHDDRLRVLSNPVNLGISHSLNKGLKEARGKFIARMDADDIAHGKRLEAQVAFMESNPKVGLCGSAVRVTDGVTSAIWRHPSQHEDIRILMMFENPLFHPTVIFRRDVAAGRQGLYEPLWDGAEDYYLWTKLSKEVVFANLQESLVTYRQPPAAIVDGRRRGLADKLRRQQIMGLGINPATVELALHSSIGRWAIEELHGRLEEVDEWLCRLVAANDKAKKYDQNLFRKVIGQRYFRVCRALSVIDCSALRHFERSKLKQYADTSIWQRSEAAVRQWWHTRAKSSG